MIRLHCKLDRARCAGKESASWPLRIDVRFMLGWHATLFDKEHGTYHLEL